MYLQIFLSQALEPGFLSAIMEEKGKCLLSSQLKVCFRVNFRLFIPPTSKKLTGHIGFELSVRQEPCRVLKFHVWILHGKIADIFFFSSELSPFLELCPVEKNQNDL